MLLSEGLHKLQLQDQGQLLAQDWSLSWGCYHASTCMQIAVVESTVTLTVFPGVTSAVCSEHNAATTAPCHPFSRRGRLYGTSALIWSLPLPCKIAVITAAASVLLELVPCWQAKVPTILVLQMSNHA